MKSLKIITFAAIAAVGQLGAQAGSYAPGYEIPDDHDDFSPRGTKWGASQVPGTPGGTVTYSYIPTGTSTAASHPGTFTHVSGAGLGVGVFEAEMAAAFAAWQNVANIQFSQVADLGNPHNSGPGGQGTDGSGDIRIGLAQFDGAGGVLAHAYYPTFPLNSRSGDIHFDIGDTWKVGFGGAGFSVFQVGAHEIGHSIGLQHETTNLALMNPFYTEAFSGPIADDIAGAQFIYGRAQNPVPEGGSTVLFLGLVVISLGAFRKRMA